MKGKIIVLEDNEDDAFLMKRSLEKGGIGNEVVLLESMRELHDFLAENEEEIPLIVITLTMKEERGLEVIRQVRLQPALKRSLVVAVGNSSLPVDIQQALDEGANAYYSKGIDFHDLPQAIKNLEFI